MRHHVVVFALAVLAYAPVMGGGFLNHDDLRFVRNNPAVHSLSPESIASFFTDPTTVSEVGWGGIYRPLRTLDFAIDWAVSGGAGWFFHVRSILYHAIASLLVLAVLRRLLAGPRPALCGALLFALHPLQSESVAWITSRGDVLLGCLFLGALLCHLKGRHVLAALLLVSACLAKEAAVVFPGVALATDLFRRERPKWVWLAVYGSVVALYVALWLSMGVTEEHGFGHREAWWGGSYGANLVTMGRVLLYYAGMVLFPVRQVVEYFVPAGGGFDLGAALGTALLAAALVWAWRGGRRVRLGLAWVALTILPVGNLLFTVGIPSAERFLYLPLVGVAVIVGPILARTRLSIAVAVCLVALTALRAGDWRSDERLIAANERAAPTSYALYQRAVESLSEAHEALGELDTRRMRKAAERTVELADRLARLYEDVGREPDLMCGLALVKKANALLLLGRPADALEAARLSVRYQGGADAEFNVGGALSRLGKDEEALGHFAAAVEMGYRDPSLKGKVVRKLNRFGAILERRGETDRAREQYERSLRLDPDPARNADAHEGLRRLRR